MKKYLLLLASLGFVQSGVALTDDQQFIENLRDQSAALLHQAPTLPDNLTPRAVPENDKAWIDNLLKKQQQAQQQTRDAQQSQIEHASPFAYFVSFSIPQTALKQMIPEATELGIPTLINGLIDNDFRKTANAVFELTKESGDGGVQIDPKTFAQFGITQVPALVVRCEQGFDVIYGNIHLLSAVEKMANEGDCRTTARAWLQQREGQ
ncbi:type-F conjugative transfer system pilin assembly protein TrbC [Providencia heimbachae]|uniref:type-F conjugative transfer system pilin assembly protein TrbC n=1 Tax=Providencia heimbachae TaxID=333962 RepID=UPI00223F5D48|nr:type-F conjugative transfer system pilin assembly protein TrbC [Providencia heimbachae]